MKLYLPIHPIILQYYIHKCNKDIDNNHLCNIMIKSSILTNISIRIIQGDLSESIFPLNWNYYKEYFTIYSDKKSKYRIFNKYITEYITDDLIKRELIGYKRKHSGRSSYYSLSSKFKNLLEDIKNSNEMYDTYNISQVNFELTLQKKILFNDKYYDTIKDAVKLEYTVKNLKEFNEKRKYISEHSTQLLVHNIDSLYLKKEESYSINDVLGLQPDIFHYTLINNNTVNELIQGGSDESQISILNSIKCKLQNNILCNAYYQSQHGRYYQSGKNVQFLKKDIRNKILEYYTDVDIKASTYTILYNYSKEFGFSDYDLPLLTSFAKDPDSFRFSLYNEFKKTDSGLEISYIKFILNSIAFGAKFNEYRIISDIVNNTKRTIPVQGEGYTRPETPLNVCSNPIIKGLAEELKYLTNHIKSKLMKNNVIINKSDKAMAIHSRTPYGKVLSHLYQGVESKVLYNIFNYKLNDIPLIEINNAIGLLLHDGLYIRTELVNQYDLLNNLKSYIKEKMNYTINFG